MAGLKHGMVELLVIATLVSTALAYEPCGCPRINSPVCGSDGVTYANKCELECNSDQSLHKLKVIKEGSCPFCGCDSGWFTKVCGSDGYTYPDVCIFDCLKPHNPGVQVVSVGPCAQPRSQ
ncbi:kazal-type trypsin inhibitor-like [Anticarsia gemmatalis]|uniref:kazal-type trypsin inhibitor-like n=1 Tax=Anticarsia gemmatalis TaxID=129554 RepID=UPI003F764CAF